MNFFRKRNSTDRERLTTIPFAMYLLIVIIGFIVIGIVGYGFYTGIRMNRTYAPLVDAAHEIKLKATTAHLWLEELIGGDRNKDINLVWKHLNEADWYARAMLEGGRNQKGTFIPLDDAEMRREIRIMQKKLAEFRDITTQRMAKIKTSGVGTAIEMRYDSMFSDFVNKADKVETRLQHIMSKDFGKFQFTQIILIVFSSLLFMSIGIAFRRFERNRAKDFLALNEAKASLEKEMFERKKVDNELRENQAMLQSVFRSAPTGIGVVSNRVLSWTNEKLSQMTGYASEEMSGQSARMLYPNDEDFEWVGKEKYSQIEETGTGTVETRWQLKNGKIIDVLLSSTPIDPSDLSAGVTFTALDISDRKRVEKEREALITKLEAKNAELEQFTYSVSHDLKSPVITIKGFLGMMEKAAIKGDIDRMRIDMARISDAADKMQRLLDELLELARVGYLINPSEEVLFEDLVREAMDAVAGQLAERNVQVAIAQDLPLVYGDRLRLSQVLQNLLENAVKFLGDQPSPSIEIGVKRNGGEAIFYIRDNGMGIDPKHHKTIFGLFHKLDQKIEGTGAGLAIVKRIVEVHHGQIWVESKGVGKGTTFYFTIPDTRESAA